MSSFNFSNLQPERRQTLTEGPMAKLNCMRLRSSLKKINQEIAQGKVDIAKLRKNRVDAKHIKLAIESVKGLQSNVGALKLKIKANNC